MLIGRTVGTSFSRDGVRGMRGRELYWDGWVDRWMDGWTDGLGEIFTPGLFPKRCTIGSEWLMSADFDMNERWDFLGYRDGREGASIKSFH
jgi:hypothetical protein